MRMLLAVATPTLMMAPMRAGTLNVVWVTEHPHDAGEPRGEGGDDNKWIEPRLKVHDHQEIDERDREDQPEAEPDERGVHALHLTPHRDRMAGRQLAPVLGHDLLHGGGHATEVTAL